MDNSRSNPAFIESAIKSTLKALGLPVPDDDTYTRHFKFDDVDIDASYQPTITIHNEHLLPLLCPGITGPVGGYIKLRLPDDETLPARLTEILSIAIPELLHKEWLSCDQLATEVGASLTQTWNAAHWRDFVPSFHTGRSGYFIAKEYSDPDKYWQAIHAGQDSFLEDYGFRRADDKRDLDI